MEDKTCILYAYTHIFSLFEILFLSFQGYSSFCFEVLTRQKLCTRDLYKALHSEFPLDFLEAFVVLMHGLLLQKGFGLD